MKMRFLIAISIAALTLVAVACRASGFYSQTGIVSIEDRVAIPPGQNTGAWNGRDLSVEYRYSREQSSMDLSGAVEFAFFMTNGYSALHDFRLSAIFLDGNGKVLNTQGITTQRGDLEPIPFRKRVVVPASAAFMSFSYQGSAIDGGTHAGGSKYFWYYPVH